VRESLVRRRRQVWLTRGVGLLVLVSTIVLAFVTPLHSCVVYPCSVLPDMCGSTRLRTVCHVSVFSQVAVLVVGVSVAAQAWMATLRPIGDATISNVERLRRERPR
jgi:hypothetical protein